MMPRGRECEYLEPSLVHQWYVQTGPTKSDHRYRVHRAQALHMGRAEIVMGSR